MRKIILCEGETDATLIGLYIEKITEWKYKNLKNPIINIPKKFPSGNESVTHYFQEDNQKDVLLICSVGGKDKFKYFFEKYLYPMIKTANKVEREYRIALVTDADNRDINDIETDILNQLSLCVKSLSNNVWKPNSFQGDFEDIISIDFLLSVIPQDKTGALETVLLDALSENTEGKVVVDSSIDFINQLPYISYIPTDRLKLKAKLGVVLSVIYPDKVFSQFDQQLQMVDWSESDTLSACFAELINI